MQFIERHFSEISEWLRCTQAHHYHYGERIEANRLNARMNHGSLGHIILMARARGLPEFDAESAGWAWVHAWLKTQEHVTPDESLAFKAKAKTTIQIALAAWKWLTERMKFKVILVEHEMVFEQSYGEHAFRFVGTLDLLMEDPDGFLWIVDHKFRSDFRDGASEDLNLQMAMYQYMLFRSKGIKVTGSMQFQIFPELPKEPKLNKDGKSVARNDIMTDWATYSATVEKYGLNPYDYGDMRERLEKHQFYDTERTRTFRTMEECERIWFKVVVPASRLIEDRRIVVPVMEYSRCRSCSFREMCIETMKGGDTDLLKKTAFHVIGQKPVFYAFEDDT